MVAAPQTVPPESKFNRCTKKPVAIKKMPVFAWLWDVCMCSHKETETQSKIYQAKSKQSKTYRKAVKRTRVPTKINMAKTMITKQRCDYTQDLHHLVFRHEKFDKKRYPCLRSCKLEVDCTCRPHNPPQLRATAVQHPFTRPLKPGHHRTWCFSLATASQTKSF